MINHLGDSHDFTIKNTGNVPLEWHLETTEDYYLISPFSGVLHPGETVNPQVLVFRDELPEGVYHSSIFLTTDKEISHQISLEIFTFSEQKWLLQVGIVDAEYCKSIDKIVAVSDKNELLIIDPIAQTIKALDLGIPSMALSLHPDGRHAVVGHIAAISYVDLKEERFIKQVGLPFALFDLVAGPEDWVYINPDGYESGSLFLLNLRDGHSEWSNDVSIYPNTRLLLHPSGKYILGANTNIIPSDVYKIEISAGSANLLYDSPYHGEFNFAGKIWVSEDGYHLFDRSGNVFRIVEDRGFDLTFQGKLPSESFFSSINHSSKIGRIFGIHNSSERSGYAHNGQDILAKYDLNYHLIEEIPLPNFMVVEADNRPRILKSRTRFGFFNNECSEYFVISCAVDPTRPEFQQWAVTTISVGK